MLIILFSSRGNEEEEEEAFFLSMLAIHVPAVEFTDDRPLGCEIARTSYLLLV